MYLPWLETFTRLFRTKGQPSNVQSGNSLNAPESGGLLDRIRQHPSPPTENIQRNSSRLFALIIGIDQYKDPAINNLAADAQAVEDFFTSTVGVSRERIATLTDKRATREAMVKAIRDLAYNPEIGAHDPILIYYAGHGSYAPTPLPEQWSTANGMIQMLCPYDFASKGSNSLQGQGLFDLKITMLLEEIAQKKSNNITVIFDCCHSGSGTRINHDKTVAARNIRLPPDYAIPANVLKLDLEGHATVVGSGAYLLLSACRRAESAMERAGRGVFTSELLNLLRKEGVRRLTYKDVILRMRDLPVQHPQCEGRDQDRILFDARVDSLDPSWYNIRTAPNSNDYILDAGEMQGITVDATFDVYKDIVRTTLIGSVVAIETSTSRTRCSAKDNLFSLSRPAYAVQTHVGREQDLSLFIRDTVKLAGLVEKLKEEMSEPTTSKRSFRLVDHVDQNPDLIIDTKGDCVEFYLNEPLCLRYGLKCMPFEIWVNDIDFIILILRSAADFYWKLRHSSNHSTLTENITMECFKLVLSQEFSEQQLLTFLVPDPQSKNLNIDSTIFIDVEERSDYGHFNESVKYGYRITNKSSVPLYAALLYFDPSDLSINRLDLPVAAKTPVDTPLPGNGSMSIGFGDGGMPPQCYFLRPNHSVDVGFLKLYVSTQSFDFSALCQVSPFSQSRSPSISRSPPVRTSNWSTVMIPVIQYSGVPTWHS